MFIILHHVLQLFMNDFHMVYICGVGSTLYTMQPIPSLFVFLTLEFMMPL